MLISDRIYGKTSISSPAIIELIKSKSFQRLKGISQFGVPDEYYHLVNYTRFEHCVGVMALLKKLGASEEEQIAGLLHDVSHTAFSHVVDWVIGDGRTENYQDEHHRAFLKSSEIPKILKTYGFSVARVADYHNFGLLERKAPELCADRVDYSIREFPVKIALQSVPKFTTQDNKIVFTDEESALLFARNYLERQMAHWGGFEAVSRYRLFADILKHAIEKKIITLKDFWQDDNFVLKKLKNAKNETIDRQLNILSNKSLAKFPKSEKKVYKKFRYVDPLFIKNKKLVRLSLNNKVFKKELDEARRKNEEGTVLPLIYY